MKSKQTLSIWCFLLLLLLAACTPVPFAAPITPTTLTDAVAQDAQGYAEEYGLSIDEAVSRLMLQDSIGELNAALTLGERETFGGLWIEHAPQYRIVTRFTSEGEKTIQPYIENGPLSDLVEVRPAHATLVELETALAQTADALSQLDFGVNASISVQENRVEIYVTDSVWFEGELDKANIVLPNHAVLVSVEGISAADRDVCSASPVEGVFFPRQAPVEGFRIVMEAVSIGELVLEEGCMRVNSIFDDGSSVPVWPAEYSIQDTNGLIEVLDESGKVVAQVGEEVFMSGGQGSIEAVPACIREQLPASCRGPVWVVGDQVRPNLKHDSELFSLNEISGESRTLLFLNKKPVLDEWVTDISQLAGTLVWSEPERCLRLATEADPVGRLLLWPQGFTGRITENGVEVLDPSETVVVKQGGEIQFEGGQIPVTWDEESYRALLSELPWDCHGPYWIVADPVK